MVDAQAASRDDLGQRLSDPHGTDQPPHRTKCALACVCTLGAELGRVTESGPRSLAISDFASTRFTLPVDLFWGDLGRMTGKPELEV